ncbi:MAG TPA: hypothetical protein VGD56_14640, partial [Gemmatirosa sp.]
TVRDPLDALERTLRSLGDELAFFRRRAIEAERRVRDVLAQQAPGDGTGARSAEADRERIAALEAENAALRARIADAAERTRAVASRMRFARQQDDAAAVDGVA